MANRIQRLLELSTRQRFLLVAIIDAVITAVALSTALILRFEPSEALRPLGGYAVQVFALLVGCRLVSVVLFKLHRWSFRLSGLTDGARIVMAGIAGTALFVWLLYLMNPAMPARLGRAVLVLELLLSTSLMALLRFGPRLGLTYRADLIRGRNSDSVVTAIVGAGSAGEMLLRGLQRTDHDYRIVGFIDDNPTKYGHIVGGKSVLGAVADLPRLVERYGISQILIAIPKLPARRVREILDLSTNLKLRFKILPVSYNLNEHSASSQLQDLTPEDLLDREELHFTQGREASFFSGGQQMVVGAAGSIGSEVCVQLLQAGVQRLVMVDIDENGLYLLKRRLERLHPGPMIVAEVADIRDTSRLEVVFNRHRPVDVFHAAARKQVPLMEAAPGEAVKTNVFGTLNLARAASDYGAERFVYMSTDKAVRASSVMGATKRLGEILTLRMNAEESRSTRFSAVRFGNVLGSAGSVVPLFREQIEAGGPVTVTHQDVRRYFMTISEAVGLVLRAAYGDYGPLCVLEMGEPISIVRLARMMITMSGQIPDIDVKIAYVGLRPGEKLSEDLIGADETVVREIDSKIRVVGKRASAAEETAEDLHARINDLRVAAATEDHEAVIYWLRQLVPEYRPLMAAAGEEEQVPEDAQVM
ncbi:MAG: nucleoside-diphosphate sugar epimerase/dehydratase [Acidobacteriota bacterium]